MNKMNILQYLNIPIENNKNEKTDKDIIEDKESQNLPLLQTQDNENLCSFLCKDTSELTEKEYNKKLILKFLFYPS